MKIGRCEVFERSSGLLHKKTRAPQNSSQPPFCPKWTDRAQNSVNVVIPWHVHVYRIWSGSATFCRTYSGKIDFSAQKVNTIIGFHPTINWNWITLAYLILVTDMSGVFFTISSYFSEFFYSLVYRSCCPPFQCVPSSTFHCLNTEHDRKNKNLAIANRSRVSCAHNTSRASIDLITHDLESRSKVTQGHWKRNNWTDHTRLTISRVIWRWILSWPWNVG